MRGENVQGLIGGYNYNRVFGTDCKCKWCGKKFHIPSYVVDWYWRHGQDIMCSYTCMRAAERDAAEREERKQLLKEQRKKEAEARKEAARKEKRRTEYAQRSWVREKEREEIIELRKRGLTYAAIAEIYKRSQSTIKDIIDREKEEHGND